MGPLRRGLIAAVLWPSAARAEVCDKERPSWSPDDGPVTWLSEPLYLYADWFGLVLLASLIVALVVRTRFALAFTMLLHAITVGTLVMGAGTGDPTGIRALAIAEGCVGPPHLSIAVLTAITVATFYMVVRSRTQQET